MNIIPLVYVFVAYAVGGSLYRSLLYVELVQPLSIELRPRYRSVLYGRACECSYWHLLFVLLCNPVVMLHYALISTFVVAFFASMVLLLYQLVCYGIVLHLLLHFSYRFWNTAKLYNRGSIFCRSFYLMRCYARDLLEGCSTIPHMLQTSLLVFFSGLPPAVHYQVVLWLGLF